MTRNPLHLAALVATLAALTAWYTPHSDDGWRDKVAPDLLALAQEEGQVQFIVFMREQADLSAARQMGSKTARAEYVDNRLRSVAWRTQRRVRSVLEHAQAHYHSFHIVNAVHTRGDLTLLAQLAQLPEVANLQRNAPIRLEDPMPDRDDLPGTRGVIEWGVQRIGAPEVWDLGYTGQGVTVGGADTGVDWQHPAIRDQYRGWDDGTVDHNYNWFDGVTELSPLNNDTSNVASHNPCGLASTLPCDDHNHGTHTVGTMIGDDGQGNQIGVAPGARWIACRNMERGWGSLATYMACFEWFLAPTNSEGEDPDVTKAPHVINNSWYCPEVEGCNASNWAVMQVAVENLKASGVVVVASAGNRGPGCSTIADPAAMFEAAFAVGATRQNDTIANFSSRGLVAADSSFRLKPDVAAPGVGVRSATRFGNYATWNGTSMAGPHVAGLVALMISANPQLAGQVEVIEQIIRATALPVQADQDCGVSGLDIPNAVYGHGRINGVAAVQAAIDLIVDTENPTSPAPRLSIAPNPAGATLHITAIPPLQGPATLSLFDATGRLALQERLPNGDTQRHINVSDLAPGVYFYRLEAEGRRFSGKIVKGN